MMSAKYDVIVVGVGTMGSSVCAELARRGVRVLGLERFAIPHGMGAHHGHSRMFRLAYFEHPDYVPLLRRSLEGWGELNGRTSLKPFVRTGGLYMGRADSDLVAESSRAAREHGIDIEELSRDDLAERYPQFHAPDDNVALFEPNAGYIVPEHTVSAYATDAIAHGADLRGNTQVMDWEVDSSGVIVRTESGEYRADKLVLSCGAWSGRELKSIGVRLRVTRQILGWVNPPEPELFVPGVLPCWAAFHADGHTYYGFPMLPSNPGLKVARHWVGGRVDPETVERLPRPDDEDEFRPFIREYLPGADGPLVSMAVCMYANSLDKHFIVDLHPKSDRVVLAAGFSGHGFKFAPVMGEVLADLAIDGRSDMPIGFLGLERFNRAGRR